MLLLPKVIKYRIKNVINIICYFAFCLLLLVIIHTCELIQCYVMLKYGCYIKVWLLY